MQIVSVGIPTYNRPEGLRRTLECIINQTYKDLEIIISDNCSPNPEVQKVAQEFVEKDRRIQYYRQKENIGAAANFRFVVKKAGGKYFMWAADDDEWDETYIAICVEYIGDHGSIFPGAPAVKWRKSGRMYIHNVLEISNNHSQFKNIANFLADMQPNLVYAMHKKEVAEEITCIPVFDWWDCYSIMWIILHHGFLVFPNIGKPYLYVVGIDDTDYVPKPCNPQKGRQFQYYPIISHCISLWIKSTTFTIPEKIFLCLKTLFLFCNSFLKFERPYRGFLVLTSYRAVRKTLFLLSKLSWVYVREKSIHKS